MGDDEVDRSRVIAAGDADGATNPVAEDPPELALEDAVDEEGWESFPASDPPSTWPGAKDGAG